MQQLEYCEAHQIPVVIGPFISNNCPLLPERYFQDENRNILSAEQLNERYDEIIKAMFEALKAQYPALKIHGVIVSTDCILTQYDTSSNHWQEKVYKSDYTKYLSALLASAKKYCPEGCKLYAEEYLPENEADIEKFKAAAEKLKNETNCLDGVAVSIAANGVDGWQEQAPFFEKTMEAFAGSGLDVILSDVFISATPAYSDLSRSAGYQAAFTDFLRYQDVISMILLDDAGGWLDGPHPLEQTYGFTEAIIRASENAAKTSSQTITPGDVNCDNTVDVSDAVLLARFVAEDTAARITDRGRANCDADGNGKVEPEDVIHILKAIAKLILVPLRTLSAVLAYAEHSVLSCQQYAVRSECHMGRAARQKVTAASVPVEAEIMLHG